MPDNPYVIAGAVWVTSAKRRNCSRHVVDKKIEGLPIGQLYALTLCGQQSRFVPVNADSGVPACPLCLRKLARLAPQEAAS